jgi:hypothetical protein
MMQQQPMPPTGNFTKKTLKIVILGDSGYVFFKIFIYIFLLDTFIKGSRKNEDFFLLPEFRCVCVFFVMLSIVIKKKAIGLLIITFSFAKINYQRPKQNKTKNVNKPKQ